MNRGTSNAPTLYLFGLINYLLGFAIQSSLIFIPLLGAELGANDFQVGLIGAVYGAAFLVSSLFSGWKSDSFGRIMFMRWGLFAGILAFASQLLADSVFLLILSRGAVGLALGISMAATIAYAFEMGMDMGKFSSYASLGWIFSAITAALVESTSMLFLLSSVACSLSFMLTFLFKETLPRQSVKAPNLWRVLRRGSRVFLAVALRHIGATSVWIVLPLYMVSLGMDKFFISIAWSTNFIVQFIVMRILERFPEHKIFALGQLLSVLVFSSLAIASSKASLLAIQALLGVAWSLLYVGALLIVLKSGEERGTAGGIFQSTLNLCAAIGPLLGGLIANGWGYRGVMIFAAALGLLGMFIAVPKTQSKTIS